MKYGFIKTAAQTINTQVADCLHNEKEIIKAIDDNYKNGVKLLVFPELAVTGYTCGDLFLNETLISAAEKSLLSIVRATKNYEMAVAVGCPIAAKNELYNCGVIMYKGDILGVVPKKNIPGYGEFYETRYFSSAPDELAEIKIGDNLYSFGTDMIFFCKELPEFSFAAEICEDLWVADSPSAAHVQEGATIIVNLSASNETVTKSEYRRDLVKMQSAKLVCGYVLAGAGEGESTTDLIFAGHNIIAENGRIIGESDLFENEVTAGVIDVKKIAKERRRMLKNNTNEYLKKEFSMKLTETDLKGVISPEPFGGEDEKRYETILKMQVSGLKKRMLHTKARSMVIGISGGLDSCLALIVCAETADRIGMGRENITAITMPCFGTTGHTKSNALILCEELNIPCRELDISESVKRHLTEIGHDINNTDVVYENAQARQRTLVLMNMANKTGGLVIGTGDLSELALGWATYNGDQMSMYGVNADVPKTVVRKVVKFYADSSENKKLKKVLYDILDTPVSPELLPADGEETAQKTEDIVGPYELHDFYLYYFVRWGFSPEKIFNMAKYAFEGEYEGKTILKWLETFCRRFFSQQFKRSCMPDGPKVGTVGLSPRGDFRMPSDAMWTAWKTELENLR